MDTDKLKIVEVTSAYAGIACVVVSICAKLLILRYAKDSAKTI